MIQDIDMSRQWTHTTPFSDTRRHIQHVSFLFFGGGFGGGACRCFCCIPFFPGSARNLRAVSSSDARPVPVPDPTRCGWRLRGRGKTFQVPSTLYRCQFSSFILLRNNMQRQLKPRPQNVFLLNISTQNDGAMPQRHHPCFQLLLAD